MILPNQILKALFTLAITLFASNANAQYATLPFTDDLSSGSLGSHWAFSDVQGIGASAVTDLSGGWPNFGTCSAGICGNVGVTGGNGVILYNSTAPTGSNQLNMDLSLDLDGMGVVELQQAIVDWNSGYDSIQILLSNDGGANFTYASSIKLWLAPHSDGIWNEVTIDLSGLAASTGVSFNSTYVVRYATYLEKIGSATNPKNWPNQSVYFDNFKGTEVEALPVELTSFSGVASEESTGLVWSTSSENNNSHFEIQKSTDGKVWESIGVVDGAGNSAEVIEYEFADYNIYTEVNYYRIKQVDFDGSFKYSNSISFNTKNSMPAISVISNGMSPVVSVTGVENGEINILSMNGKSVWKKESIDGYWLDLGFLPNGNYIVMVNSEAGYLTEKIAVIK